MAGADHRSPPPATSAGPITWPTRPPCRPTAPTPQPRTVNPRRPCYFRYRQRILRAPRALRRPRYRDGPQVPHLLSLPFLLGFGGGRPRSGAATVHRAYPNGKHLGTLPISPVVGRSTSAACERIAADLLVSLGGGGRARCGAGVLDAVGSHDAVTGRDGADGHHRRGHPEHPNAGAASVGGYKEITAKTATSAQRVHAKLAQLAEWIELRSDVPSMRRFAEYLLPKIRTGRAGTLHFSSGAAPPRCSPNRTTDRRDRWGQLARSGAPWQAIIRQA